MKTLILLLFCFTMSAQSYIVDCAKCEKLSKLNCTSCSSLELQNFTGIILKGVNAKDILLHYPVRTYLSKGNVTFIDVAGTTVNTNLSRLINISSYTELQNFTSSCFCTGGTGLDTSSFKTVAGQIILGTGDISTSPEDIELIYLTDSLQVTIDGVVSNKIHFVAEQGPQGIQGEQGPQGLTGNTGPQGDDGVGVPAGGTTGQLLAKNSGTDFDTEWVDAPSGGSTPYQLPERVNTLAPTSELFSTTVPTNRDYHMLPRLCQNLTNGVLTQIYRAGTGHVGTGDYGVAILRRSLDNGKTWHGINPANTYTQILSETNIDLRNYGVFYTNTGRLILIYARYTGTSWAGMDTRYIYSDDDGVTWTSPTILPGSATSTVGLGPTTPYSSRCVYDSTGAIIYPFYETITATESRIKLMRSTDNGVTWANYSVAFYDNTIRVSEPTIQDFGDGLFIMVVRTDTDPTLLKFYPKIMRSNNYGLTWAGATETLTLSDINSGLHGSGVLQVEGAGVAVGSTTNSCLPEINKMTYKGSQYLILFHHMRLAGATFNDLRVNVLNLDDYLNSGLTEFEYIATTVYAGLDNGAGNPNGGNSSSLIYGNEMLIATGEQTGSSSSGAQRIVTLYTRANFITKLIDAYLALK